MCAASGDADEDGLEVLARPAPGAPVDVSLEPVLQAQAGPAQHLGVQVAPVVDHDAHWRAGRERAADVAEDGRDPLDVLLERPPAGAQSGTAELAVAALA